MKKILSVMLIFCFVFSFAGCGKKKDDGEKKGTLDIEYYTEAGQMPECKYVLGADPETIKADITALIEAEEDSDGGHSEIVYDVSEDEEGKNVEINNGTFRYFYKKANPDKGVGCIVNAGTAYGFEPGTVIVEVKEAIAGCDDVEEEANEDNAFFLYGPLMGTVLRCDAGDNTVVFVFADNALCATAIFTGEDW